MCCVELAGLRFGEGLPKICVPLTAGSTPALLAEATAARDLPADLYEWRIDGYFGSHSEGLDMLQRVLGGRPLLCTLRTKGEGGKADLGPEAYETFLRALLEHGGFQLLDVELSCGEERVSRLTELAHEKGVGVVASRHDFEKTPSLREMTEILLCMKELGADLPKLAVTPRSPRDVLELMEATLRASERIGPVITMSMGDMGKLSRVSGQLTGSCLSFGAGEQASAPGQVNCEDLRAILEDLSF